MQFFSTRFWDHAVPFCGTFSVKQNSCYLSLTLLYFVSLLLLIYACSPLLIHFDFGGETYSCSFSALIVFPTELWFCPCPHILHKRNLHPGCIVFSRPRGCFFEPFSRPEPLFQFDCMWKLIFENFTGYCPTYVFWDFWDIHFLPFPSSIPSSIHPSLSPCFPTSLMFLRLPSWLALCSPSMGHTLKLLL